MTTVLKDLVHLSREEQMTIICGLTMDELEVMDFLLATRWEEIG